MLDGCHSGTQCGHDSRLTVAMRRHNAIGTPGFLDDRSHLLIAELLVNGMVQFAHNTAGGAYLKESGAGTKLAAKLMKTLGYPIAESEHRRCCFGGMKNVQRKSMNISVTAGHAEYATGRIDVRARNRTVGHRSGEEDSKP